MKLKLFSLLAAVMLFCTGCTAESSIPTDAEPSESYPLTVDFLKVGKADAAVIKTQNHVVVIDCGEKSDGKKIRNCMNTLGADSIDYMILTHYDQDHIGGAKKVVSEFNVGHILAPDYHEASKEYDHLCEAMSAKNIGFDIISDSVATFTLDDARFEVYPCQQQSYTDGDDNNHSLVIRMTHHDEVFLFAADAMQERLAEIMSIGDCDVLKEPYHGRDIPNLGEFLDKTTPEYAVVSTDEENYSPAVGQLLDDRHIQTYITFQDGNIRCTSTGTSLSFDTNLDFKTNDEDDLNVET